MIWTLIALAAYCDHFNCYVEIDGDCKLAYGYWNDGSAMGVTFNIY